MNDLAALTVLLAPSLLLADLSRMFCLFAAHAAAAVTTPGKCVSNVKRSDDDKYRPYMDARLVMMMMVIAMMSPMMMMFACRMIWFFYNACWLRFAPVCR